MRVPTVSGRIDVCTWSGLRPEGGSFGHGGQTCETGIVRLDCPICGDFARDPATSGLARAYGEPTAQRARFLEREGFTLFCPVAPLVVGYLMIAPTDHDERVLLHQPTPQLAGAVDSVLAGLERGFGAAWAFEHASTSADGTSCVPHAHVHLLPGWPPLRLFESATATSLPDEDVADVYVRTTTGTVGLVVRPRRRQHVRIILAAETQRALSWDWRLDRQDAIYRATCSVLDQIAPTLDGFAGASEDDELLDGR